MKPYLTSRRSYLKPSFNLFYTIAHGVTLLLVVSAFYLINLPPDKIAPNPTSKNTTPLQVLATTQLLNLSTPNKLKF